MQVVDPVPPVVTTLAIVGVLTVTLASLLVLADRRLRVEEDPRLDHLEALLPATNCGACGQPGCRAFAEALIAGQAVPAGCSVSSADAKQSIAQFLGVEAVEPTDALG